MTRSPSHKIVQDLSSLEAQSFDSETERLEVRDALVAALRRTQSPWDVALDHVWTQPAETAAVKTLIEAGFWKKWIAAGGQPSTSKSLGQLSSIDPVLLKRLLRFLAGQKRLNEVGQDTYALTPYSKALAEDRFSALYTSLYKINQPIMANFPKWAAETKYTNDFDPNFNNFHSWFKPGETMFTMLEADPAAGLAWARSMEMYSSTRTQWTDVYPTNSIVAAAKPGAALVVDIGGSRGHDLEKFRAKHPNVPQGSLIVQDLPNVVANLQLEPPCVVQSYDFFQPQPVKGARAYYMHNVLHDWDDVKAVEILKIVARSMSRGYSRILIHEMAVPPEGAHHQLSLSDVVMLMALGALERTHENWEALVAQAGLKILKFWPASDGMESIIEAELL